MAAKQISQNRKFGMELVGEIPWGTHLCQFYQTKQDLIDILVPYFAQGLQSNEYCMWVTSPPLEAAEAEEALRKAVPNLDTYLSKGQISIVSYNDWYLQGGSFDAERVLQRWVERETAALKHGFAGLRLAGNTFWLERKLWQNFVNYEEALNKLINQHKMLALCNYYLTECNGADVLDVVRNHVGTLTKQGQKWGIIEEIAEHKKAEKALSNLNRHLRAISNSNQALMKAFDEKKFTQEVCNIIVHDCGYALVWVGVGQNDKQKSVKPVAYAGFDKSYIEALNITWSADSERGRGPTGTVIRTGKRYVCKNMAKDPNFKPWLQQATNRGYTASAVLPLTDFERKTFGALNIYSTEPDPFSDEELKLLTELANDFAYGLTILKMRREKEHADMLMRKQASLIDLSPAAIMIRSLEGDISFWSAGAQKLYGWTKEEAIGKKTHALLKTQFSEPSDYVLEELKRKGKWSGELMHQAKDGDTVIVQSYWLATRTVRGEITEIMESNVDITSQKEMQSKLGEYAAHLEELIEERTQQLKDSERLTAIGETAGMVGHDLRNPLQTITGEMYLAKTELADLPDGPQKRNLQETVNTISDQIGYMNKIVSDLQDFVKPITPDKKNVDLSKLIKDTLKEVPVPSNVQITVTSNPDLLEMRADDQLLKRVLFNLFNNAVQAMPNGGTLTITAKQEDDADKSEVVIAIQDTGEGIPDNVQTKIFRPLFTTKSKGQGFGLAVCKRVIEAHGGTIRFESKVGKGTQFLVELPTN